MEREAGAAAASGEPAADRRSCVALVAAGRCPENNMCYFQKAESDCYVPGKDLLVPPPGFEAPAALRFLNAELDATPRTKLLFFGGAIEYQLETICSLNHNGGLTPPDDLGLATLACPWYSGGVRQTVYRMYRDDPRFEFLSVGRDVLSKEGSAYMQGVARSHFCLSPYGVGYGTRTKGSIVGGCIPVIIQDGIKVEWEDDLPMEEFSVRLPSAWIYRLPETLEALVASGRAETMQSHLRCVWPLFWWKPPLGRALRMTACVLAARASGLQQPKLDLGACTVQCTPSSQPWSIHRQRSSSGGGEGAV
uniref:Exostosin GT47 domain-containing protein n=1 Tax=Chlamydomonas euryale TaxID=1486919 RepID=A0A7R9Z3L3_9CHLO